MKNSIDLISGYGIEVNASITNRFTLYRRIIAYMNKESTHVRANDVWQKVLKVETVVKYLNYQDKIDYIGEIEKEFLIVHYDCSPLQGFFTYRIPELIENIIEQSKRGGINVRLNEFDRVPNEFLSYSEEEKLLYILEYKIRTKLASDHLRSFIYLDGSGSFWGRGDDSFSCTMSEVQVAYLCRTLKRTGFLSKKTKTYEFVDYLDSSTLKRPIQWECGTATLVYFFQRLYFEKYILNYQWGLVISKRRYTYTKKGNRLNYSNMSSSLSIIRLKNYKLRDKEKVDYVLKKLKFFGDSFAKKH